MKKMYRHEVGNLPENQTMKMKGRVRHGWHKPVKSPMQLQSEKNRRNSW